VNFLLVILASILGFAHAQFGTGNANTFVDSVRQFFLLDHLRVGRIRLCHSPLGKSAKKVF
jgi:hypothetical protein